MPSDNAITEDAPAHPYRSEATAARTAGSREVRRSLNAAGFDASHLAQRLRFFHEDALDAILSVQAGIGFQPASHEAGFAEPSSCMRKCRTQ